MTYLKVDNRDKTFGMININNKIATTGHLTPYTIFNNKFFFNVRGKSTSIILPIEFIE